MNRARVVAISLKPFTGDDEGHTATWDMPERVTIEIDAVALAWLGKVCGKFKPPRPESTHFYNVAVEVWNRFEDGGYSDVPTSSSTCQGT